MINSWRVYIKPFDASGNYTDWIDVTDDVDFDALGSIAVDLDNTEYDIGVYRNSSFKLKLRNEDGLYSDVDAPRTIFAYKRSNSLCKVTWELDNEGPYCGLVDAGDAMLSEEVVLFTGLLSDESLKMDIDQQDVSFDVLGRESIFLKTVVPFGTLSNGDLLSSVIYKCLNQSGITSLLTVSAGNISVGLDQQIDSIASLQNKTVQEGLNKLLLASNSVLFIEDDTVYVAPRTAGASVSHTFYGQAASGGVENIQSIKSIKNGLAKTFNFVTWADTTSVSQDATSVTKYGVRKKELNFEFITNATKQTNILDSIKTEFANPKQEFDLYTPLNYDTIALGLLDRVNAEYPTIYIDDDTPICGVAVCGGDQLPTALWSFTLTTDDHFKIMGRSIDIKNAIVKFKLRAI